MDSPAKQQLTKNENGGHIALCCTIHISQEALVIPRVIDPLTFKLQGGIVAANVHPGGVVNDGPVLRPGDFGERGRVHSAGNGEAHVGEGGGVCGVLSDGGFI